MKLRNIRIYRRNGKVLDISGSSMTEGGLYVQMSDDGANDQKDVLPMNPFLNNSKAQRIRPGMHTNRSTDLINGYFVYVIAFFMKSG